MKHEIKMEEIFRIADDITVMRDGQVVAEVVSKDSSADEVKRLIRSLNDAR